MSKIIIENRSDLTDIDVIDVVKSLIAIGRVSNNGKQYCYLSTFVRPNGGNYQISTDLNKKSDRFLIVKE